jgi:antitoxin component YwqK of YwqJK toxin-antitoxin module
MQFLIRAFFIIAFAVLLLLTLWVSPSPIHAKKIEEDTDNDGQTDRIVHLAPSGDVVKLEADTNGDLKMDTFQYYERGAVQKIERDTDADGRIDERVLLANGKTTARHSLDVHGEIVGIFTFDGEQRPLEWRRDTIGDGRMDTVYRYEAGKPRLVTRDTTGDGRVNVWQRFRNEKPYEQTADLNGDGQIDQTIRFDEQGRSVESHHDLDADGRLETIRHYKNGDLCRQEGFMSGRKGPDVVIEFSEGQAVSEQRDTNGDDAFDVLVKMSKGKPISKEEDSNHDGRMERFTTYDERGRPLCLREFGANPDEPIKTTRFKAGELFSVEQIDNGRQVFTRFQNDKPVKQTIDENRDGRPEQTLSYDIQGRIDSAFSDTNRNGRIDSWQYYQQGVLHRTHQDRNHDGEVDAKSAYDGGRQVRQEMDNDGDGHFEIRTAFDTAEWTKVTELVDKTDRLWQRLSYSGEILRKKEIFDRATGRLVTLEEFDKSGKIVMSQEAENGTGALLTWRYDTEEKAVAAEKDSDGDGLADIWYHYENGRVTRVEEDRNKDGKPDLWETYDAAQAVVCQSEDLDFDGTADIERRY